jgi:hypothetical protein
MLALVLYSASKLGLVFDPAIRFIWKLIRMRGRRPLLRRSPMTIRHVHSSSLAVKLADSGALPTSNNLTGTLSICSSAQHDGLIVV